MTLPPLAHIAFTIVLLALGGLGGTVMAWLGMPLPYMLGSLTASALAVAVGQRRFPAGYEFPMKVRMIFVGVIGTMIGARLTPDVLSLLPLMLVSVPAVAVFVLGAHATNYLIFRRLGGYDRATAYYSGSPGGLFESILFGEDAGADVRILTLMQFLRIIVVVTLVPVGMSLWEGHPVGSAGGMSFSPGATDWHDIPLVTVIALAGLWVGSRLKLPAAQLMGPLLVAGALAMTGLVDVAAPGWLVAVAQVVLGTGLGIRFTGMTRTMFLRGMGLSVVSVSAMMGLGVLLAAGVHIATGLPTDMLVVSFAPGGVVEMSLIALSLAANPAIVTLHHLVRILFTVGEMALVHKRGWLNR
ncbi:AbrB family transcriptional regulator [Sinisalibacter aestuarii]|uniref:Membrane protein n=1 Tax=Sinisalibacter aestuarii TaxID=2949426 RepID=A0ABQ5LSY8_9RHOB|nr:AbrB family transcriptional regulator [Sinisalibacter aestuarii]GKY87202.1 membrane protein [Sinisalibacter aestuarii]